MFERERYVIITITMCIHIYKLLSYASARYLVTAGDTSLKFFRIRLVGVAMLQNLPCVIDAKLKTLCTHDWDIVCTRV